MDGPRVRPTGLDETPAGDERRCHGDCRAITWEGAGRRRGGHPRSLLHPAGMLQRAAQWWSCLGLRRVVVTPTAAAACPLQYGEKPFARSDLVLGGDVPNTAHGDRESCHNDAHGMHLGIVGLIDTVPPGGGSTMVWPGSHRRVFHKMAQQCMNGRLAKDGELLTGQQGMREESEYADELKRLNADTEPVDTHGEAGDCVFWCDGAPTALTAAAASAPPSPPRLFAGSGSALGAVAAVFWTGTTAAATRRARTGRLKSGRHSCTISAARTLRPSGWSRHRPTCGVTGARRSGPHRGRGHGSWRSGRGLWGTSSAVSV